MENKVENAYQTCDMEEIIEESYYYYSYLESKNVNSLSSKLYEISKDNETIGVLEDIKKACFIAGYKAGIELKKLKEPV